MDHSGWMPMSRSIFVQRGSSTRMRSAKASGVLAFSWMPAALNFYFVSGRCTMLRASLFSLSMIGRGTPATVMRPNQVTTS